MSSTLFSLLKSSSPCSTSPDHTDDESILAHLIDLPSALEFIQTELKKIMRALLQEKKQHERTLALSFQQMQEEYQRRLEEKDRKIEELNLKVDSLNANAKETAREWRDTVQGLQQEIQMCKNMLRKKYLREIELQRRLKRDTRDTALPIHSSNPTLLLSSTFKPTLIAPFSRNTNRKLCQPDVQTRASTWVSRSSQLLNTLQLRSDMKKRSAVCPAPNQKDSSIITINSTRLSARIDTKREFQPE